MTGVGILRRLVLLPLAPVEGVIWLARALQDVAEEELNDPERLRGVLEEAEEAHRRGELSDEEVAAVEDEILARLVGVSVVQEDVIAPPGGTVTHG